ncbi:hypothetical protein PUMCH_000214 [Australozyma saopauloensis]|uniref:Protein SIP5 n=1 Tax=Australozyma saopauloensis TaxID=291208 RepID=A0AAX4H359_9ASCO|nr:hypothetical protein PUMCH_000214 [[Candida] saopauloensis]
MGNVPTKEPRSRSGSLNSHGTNTGGRSSRRNTALSVFNPASMKTSKSKDKLKAQAQHYNDLVVRVKELVDGGFLAPYGTYKLDLDFSTSIVRDLIIARRLAPFYTPLQDFDESWSDKEIFILISQMPLHADDDAFAEEEEELDPEDHKIHRSLNYYKRQEQKAKKREMIDKMKAERRQNDLDYLTARKSSTHNEDLSLQDLIIKLYKTAVECPICFLYFPEPMNYSRCCRQPICTECFVQIKRLEPHPPHDDPGQQDSSELPHTLISECANCPYCATADFGVTYDPPLDVHVGLGTTTKPGDYREPTIVETVAEGATDSAVDSSDETETHSVPPPTRHVKPRRRSSISADSKSVITTDFIRPDWELKLASARSRLARKSATASAIHASSLIVTGDSATGNGNRLFIDSLEDKMVEEALRLSLLEEEERQKKSPGSSSS